jgi:hypothetical protein
VTKRVIPLFFCLVFAGEQYAFAGDSSLNGEEPVKLSQRHSGYNLDKKDWVEFLTCWKNSIPREREFDDEAFLISFPANETQNKNTKSDFKQIKYKLPKSVLDFYEAYESMGGLYRDPNISDGLGIVPPTEIQAFSTHLPDYLQIKNEAAIRWESEDRKYFKYGVEQDGDQIRTGYQNNAIVIGQYGYDDYELIVLYPDSLTQDGEMETAIFAHAYEGRTPSFAEMMRQLSFYFTQESDSIPLYSQERLKGTCADKLPLKDVWWK